MGDSRGVSPVELPTEGPVHCRPHRRTRTPSRLYRQSIGHTERYDGLEEDPTRDLSSKETKRERQRFFGPSGYLRLGVGRILSLMSSIDRDS